MSSKAISLYVKQSLYVSFKSSVRVRPCGSVAIIVRMGSVQSAQSASKKIVFNYVSPCAMRYARPLGSSHYTFLWGDGGLLPGFGRSSQPLRDSGPC
jgi:hypothetical protein